jgi:hypothetical protein
VKTAATSFGSRRGISFSSTEEDDVSEVVEADVEVLEGPRNATHGLTPSSVLARFVGSSQRCSIEKPGGSFEGVVGRPISSKASRRAVVKGCSSRVSALPIKFQHQLVYVFYNSLGAHL